MDLKERVKNQLPNLLKSNRRPGRVCVCATSSFVLFWAHNESQFNLIVDQKNRSKTDSKAKCEKWSTKKSEKRNLLPNSSLDFTVLICKNYRRIEVNFRF